MRYFLSNQPGTNQLAKKPLGKKALGNKSLGNKSLGNKKQRGFTLLELVIVLVIIGILAFTAMSRFSGPSEYAAKTASVQGVSIVRQIQLARMQSSSAAADENHILQVTENCFGSKQACQSGEVNLSTRINLNNQGLTYTSTQAEISFDSLGRPVGLCTEDTACGNFHTITIASATDPSADHSTICINEEGFVFILPDFATACQAI